MDIEELQSDYESITIVIARWMQKVLSEAGVSEQWIIYVKLIVLLAILAITVYVLQFVVRKLLTFVFYRVERITKLTFFRYTINNKLPHYLALVIPYSFVRGTIPIVFYDFKGLISPLIKVTDIYLVFMIIWTIMALVKSCGDVLQEKPAFKNKPMKSYFQVIQIVLFIFAAVVIYSILTGKSATAFFAAMGAASAILMLMFKDSIMGFVGSIQISTNNMVQIGDWITMNKYGADGTIEEINLTTVKVRNFDKTITTIPTYALISDSFQNWRGMQESGGRRFKRAINLKYECIRPLTDEELEKFKRVESLAGYIKTKQKAFAKLNNGIENDLSLDKHVITNCELFMQYGIGYLKNHPHISNEMTLLVRQLSPTTQGLPIEIYTFTNTTVWAEYEIILAEVMSHLISVVKFFDLVIYEESSGSDNYNVFIKESNGLKENANN
ncbi:mechanosensitive ion channel [Dysgonomonas sp. Marseille-P4677]|uniref:mechanosensitive ion channel family protein n=1 Tax=Dysgonomonas sp. Marseille-P4677 TaxID=2364790 RepID=UPI001913B59E|nr:mechanosensitive ion channel domain-containing protein [Dysgonomonas sp. Marseille-P4677]MBK5720525.1 mechanosensitive ion channel [Dysgonomonas sp. Marseille-P4677]